MGGVAGVTARHVFDDHPKLAEFDKTPHVWALAGSTNPKVRVVMGKLIEDPAEVGDLDVVIAAAATQGGPFPALALPARKEAVEVGETVYVVGIPNEDWGPKMSRQKVYKGVVRQRRDGREFEFVVEGTIKTGGLSGSPIIDSHGEMAAVYTSHLTEQPLAGKTVMIGVDVAEILRHVVGKR